MHTSAGLFPGDVEHDLALASDPLSFASSATLRMRCWASAIPAINPVGEPCNIIAVKHSHVLIANFAGETLYCQRQGHDLLAVALRGCCCNIQSLIHICSHECSGHAMSQGLFTYAQSETDQQNTTDCNIGASPLQMCMWARPFAQLALQCWVQPAVVPRCASVQGVI